MRNILFGLGALGLVASSTPPNAAAAAAIKHYITREALPEGRVRVTVIEEAPALRANENALSQGVIYREVRPAVSVSSLNALDAIIAKRRGTFDFDSTRAGQPLWTAVKNAWDESDEDEYSAWVARNANVDFNRQSGLNADCADVGLLFRWVFARERKLPIANTLTGSGKIFGHFSGAAAWDALPTNADWKKDERFKAALRYLFDNTYTRTVVADLAPVAIRPRYVRPGTMYMIIRPTSGHTQTIVSALPGGGITTLWGNEPASDEIDRTGIIFEMGMGARTTFGRWRTPVHRGGKWVLRRAEEMPGYSLEQFQQGIGSDAEYEAWVDDRLGLFTSDESRLAKNADSFLQGITVRMGLAADGMLYCRDVPCAPTSADFDAYGTVSRDVRMRREAATVAGMIQKIGPDNGAVLDVRNRLGSLVVFPGLALTAYDLVMDPEMLARWSPDPRESSAARWGFTSGVDASTDYSLFLAAIARLLDERSIKVDYGSYLCQGTCAPDAPSVKEFSTARLDPALLKEIGAVAALERDPRISAISIRAVHADLERREIYGVGDEGNPVSHSDILYSPGAAERLRKWSAVPRLSAAKRWGY